MSVRTESDDAQQTSTDDRATPERIAKDDAFHILQNSRRRAVLRYLIERDEDRLVMRDIAEEVAAWEHDTTVARLVSEERQRVYIALYQSHLPKLDEHGLIDYNQSRGIVETTPLTRVLEPYLDDGLHADGDLTIDADADDRERDDHSRSSLSTAVSSLLNR